MRTTLETPPWGAPMPTKEMLEAINVLASGNISSIARAKYNAECRKKKAEGKRAPVGMQSNINKLLEERFTEAGWNGKDGRFRKGNTLVRITFRHYQTIGSDLLEMLKAHKRDEIELVLYLACGLEALRVIAPSQAGSMVSIEKLRAELDDANGIIEFPLMYGELIPKAF